MLKPIKDKLLLKVPKVKQIGSILVPESSIVKSSIGEVVAIGDKIEFVKVGDKVKFYTGSAFDVEFDGEEYVVLRECEIICVL